ncbi:TPA: tyrosine-type recombinase/integrase [Bacillus thuringiensis]|uniref:Phage integrase family protein n=3 Tax=Bacillus cereus group TaxID=86661 RepID=A0A9W4A3D6_BACTO|nr:MULTISPECIES: site-specific integrase [Bacillus cereus group]AEA19512.1 Phage integrase [Bacillus thuringiensis serovar chinensis CT-43]AGG05215.1 site-specific recombinase, phage integrase family [Bacillus thuringiensis serovar thuringiensis str. IS5056]AHZ54893.1 Phage integrase [Bacillus thuringiensis serovar kurstaki str. YBT-1520]AIE37339.1 Phage integrase [Bacillus thuringiensis serovar kurstaki str. HD-1]AIM34628.1 tyrosine recombinase XerC [Bacillus thuringiensis serovar kurstaki st
MSKNINLEETLAAFSAYLTEKGRKQSTIKRYAYDIKDFYKWLRENEKLLHIKSWRELSEADYQTYFSELEDKRKYSQKTRHRIWVVLKKVHMFLGIVSPLDGINFSLIPDQSLNDNDFITEMEEKLLKQTVLSTKGLTERQAKYRPLIMDRNVCIINLVVNYGLSLHELVSLNMSHIKFARNILMVPGENGATRSVFLTMEDTQQLYKYYKTIPEPVRPRQHTDNPLFVAFDFNRGTYRWVYEKDMPKALSEVAIQKMIRLEVKRAGLKRRISAQQMRNTFILRLIKQGVTEKDLVSRMGFKTKISLKRYYQYLQ